MRRKGSPNTATKLAGALFGALGVLILAKAVAGLGSDRRARLPVEAAPSQSLTNAPPYSAFRRVVIAYVAQHEGGQIGTSAINANSDGAGLSYGLIQWAQRPGGLGKVLAKMQQRDPQAFAQTFGIPWQELLRVTNASDEAGRMAPVGGVLLWQEPWISRFRQSGAYLPFVEAQWDMAENGEHMKGAEKAARILGVFSQRALTLLYDRAVQQGAYAIPKHAQEVADRYAAQGVRPGERQILLDFQRQAASGFSSANQPGSSWRPVGDVWHKFRGSIDLYADVMKRSDHVLNDPMLSDAPLPGFPR